MGVSQAAGEVFDPLVFIGQERVDDTIGLLAALEVVQTASAETATQVVASTADPQTQRRLLDDFLFLDTIDVWLDEAVETSYDPVNVGTALAFMPFERARMLGSRVALTIVDATWRVSGEIMVSDVSGDCLAAGITHGIVDTTQDEFGQASQIVQLARKQVRADAAQLSPEETVTRARLRVQEYHEVDGEDAIDRFNPWTANGRLGELALDKQAAQLSLTNWGPQIQRTLEGMPVNPSLSVADNYRAGIHHALASVALLLTPAHQ